MSIFRSIKRSWSRASFVSIIPGTAFVLGLILASGFCGFYFFKSYAAYNQHVQVDAQRFIELVQPAIETEDYARAQDVIDGFAGGHAVLQTRAGEIFAGTQTDKVAKMGRRYLVERPEGEALQVTLAPVLPYTPPLSYAAAILINLICALTAALLMRQLALLASDYLTRVNKFVETYGLDSVDTVQGLNPGTIHFKEFRQLNVVALRTTRRLSQQIHELKERAKIDERTGLANEFYLKDRLRAAIESASFNEASAMILIDFADLAEKAEPFGITQYNDFLSAIGDALKTHIKASEIAFDQPEGSWLLASLPSDQFAILVEGLPSREEVASLARRLQADFRDPITFQKQIFFLDVCASLVMIPEDGDSVSDLMQRSEATLRSSREDGRSGFRFYSPKLERQREARIKLEAELRKAVENDRFVPLYQPKIDLQTGRICAVEALARWRLDSGRLVSPAVFITLAEETGLINEIGRQIMHKACAATANWTRQGHRLDLAVNVSPRQFERDGLDTMILDGLAASGLSPRQLELEITESLAIEQPMRVRAVLKPLRKMGIRLAVDDFGTGHSNLAILTQLEFDVFKIDRQFVEGLPNDRQSIAIVGLMLDMAKSLNMRIVGEGIETKSQARFLAAKGCHIGQGYLYSPPVTDAAILKMLEAEAAATTRQSA